MSLGQVDQQRARVTVQNLNQSSNPHLNLHANVILASVWPRGQVIFVCWENPNDQFRAQMAAVQKVVSESWEASSSGVKFQGWGPCATVNRGIRILIDDSGPRTEKLGRQLEAEDDGVLKGMRNGMVLNFTFTKWGASCKSKKDSCIRGIAVHEFGHALGFAHEQNRSDVPGECLARDLTQGPAGDKSLTKYDPQSVMNYCNPQWNTGVLSILDKDALKTLYGA